MLNISREIPPKTVGGGIFDRNSPSFRPEVVSGVISGVAVEQVGMDVCVNFGDFRSNVSRDI